MLNLKVAYTTCEELVDVLQHPFGSNPDDVALLVKYELAQEIVPFFLNKAHGVPPALFRSQLFLSGGILLAAGTVIGFFASGKELKSRLIFARQIVHQLDRANRFAQEIVNRRKNVFAIEPKNFPEFRFGTI